MNISIIIPCFNVEAYLMEAVQSCLDQTIPPTEIIIVDNGSTDKTVEAAQSLVNQHSNLITLLHCSKVGASTARNMGWSQSKSEWIQFLDADDILLPSKLEVQSKRTSPEVSIVIGGAIYQQLDGTQNVIAPMEDVWKGTFKGEYAGNTCANLWNKTDLLKVGGWNEALQNTQDYDLIFRLLQVNDRVAFTHDALSIHRDRPSGQISKSDPNGNILRALELRLRMYDYLKTKRQNYLSENEEYFNQILFAFISNYAKVDLEKSNDYFSNFLGNGFFPRVNKMYYNKRFKSMIHRAIGFKRTELAWNYLRSFKTFFKCVKVN